MAPLESSVQAEYQDGFILDETEHEDISPYNEEKNVFYSILEKHPEAEHGPMVRFSVFWKNERHDVDWTDLPDNARPIRFRHGYNKMWIATGEQETGWSGVDFGYQFNDEQGKNQQEIKELR